MAAVIYFLATPPHNGFYSDILRPQFKFKYLVDKKKIMLMFLVQLHLDVLLDVFLVVGFKYLSNEIVDKYQRKIH